MTTTDKTVRLDLGTSDVSTPSGGGGSKKTSKAKIKKALAPAKKRGRRVHVRADLAPGGALHVRSLRDGERDVFLDGEVVTLADDEGKPVWIQIAKTGAFKGHPAGAFELNEQVFGEIIANFNATANRAIPIDFEHATEADSSSGSIPSEGAPAQGWIKDLKVSGGNLWGLVEWGTKAREYIRGGQYKFFSPAIRFGARDRVTGKPIGARMTSGALTNNPFLDGMKALAAKDGSRVERVAPGTYLVTPDSVPMRLAHSPTEYMPTLRYLLRMSDLSTAQEVADQLEKLREHFEAADEDPDGSHEGIDLASFVYPLRNMLGATLGMTWDDVFDRIAALIADAIGETDDDDDGMHVMPDGSLMPDAAMRGDTAAYQASLTDKATADGAAAGISPNVSALSDQKETTMAAPEEKTAELTIKNAELGVSLKDATTKLSATETKLTAAEAQVADLTLSMKDATAKLETADAELKTLRDEKTARETADLTDRVSLAFETYKDAQKLTDDDKATMLIVLKADPVRFEKKYPKVKPSEQHLLKNLTEKREGAPHIEGDGGAGKPIDLASAARALSAQRGIPLGEAQRILLRGTAPLTSR